MMKVLKASAGSGKTFRLAGTYRELLAKSHLPSPWRHILAVTFTNKATAEMKARILRDLYRESQKNTAARHMLTGILHDYSAFSVCTIDKFFQQTLKAFSREIGQFASYQIELDRDSLINEAMDRILDSLTPESTELLAWLRRSASEQIAKGGTYNPEYDLYAIGSSLKSQEHRGLAESLGIDEAQAWSKDRLDKLHSESQTIIKAFHDKVRSAASALLPKVEDQRERGWLQPYVAGFKASDKVLRPQATLLKHHPDSEFAQLFDSREFVAYNTVRIVDEHVFELGVAREFEAAFSALLKEKNIMCLDESNTILRDIIDGSDAPFVYEKLGVRYESFLLDEFQDTSNIQWENFLPLLRESDSHGGENLVVGDVKQSIYRWRDSDWSLLATRVNQEFPAASVEVLDNNWRSARTIVDFNDDLFEFLAATLSKSGLYADVRQNSKSDEHQSGYVAVDFCDKAEELDAVLESINFARKSGARWGDIAVLVRGHTEGGLVAGKLIENGIPVISDDSLDLKSALTVRRLVAMLRNIDQPGSCIEGYLASNLGVTLPDSYHSLYDLAEGLLRSLRDVDRASFEGETLFVQAFMDELQGWTAANGNNLKYFLRHYDDNTFFIGSPDSDQAVRVLTVHKSKGLEFPYVICPFAEKVNLFKPGEHWCRLDTTGTSLSPVFDGIYPVTLSSACTDTLFADSYNKEYDSQIVDNLNVFYVALTRAVKVLHIIAATPSKKCRASAGGKISYSNFGDLLYHFCEKRQQNRWGEPYDFGKMNRESKSSCAEVFESGYPSYSLGGRLQPSVEAADFFSEDGVSARISGIVMHDILSSVQTASDLEKAVAAAEQSGSLKAEDVPATLSLLSEAIASHPDWFETSGARNEQSIIGADGQTHRPDRVVCCKDGSTLVIDYKFGAPKASYADQVRGYVSLYRNMGVANVRGVVWYVKTGEVVDVC